MTTTFLSKTDNGHGLLEEDINAAALTVRLQDGGGVTFPASNFEITVGNERMLCTSRTDNDLTVVRAQHGTAATSHSMGDAVELRIVTKHITDIEEAVNTIETAQPSYATKTGAEELTNKTLSTGSVINADVTITEVLKKTYPVGSIYISILDTNPATLFGFGTWSGFASGRALVGVNTGDADFAHAEHEAGGKTHSHTTGTESADHSHGQNVTANPGTGSCARADFDADAGTYSSYAQGVNTGGRSATHTHSMGSGTADSTLQPSIAVYVWKRTA
jgi:hypothetical protein